MWDRDSLQAKAQLFFEHALENDRDDPRFGLWCAFGLELLARAATASVSSTLLAESEKDHRYLLHALGRGNPKVGPKSIAAADVFRLCEVLFPTFKPENTTAAMALINRRNAELHTGEAAFAGYTTQHWIGGFYACAQILAEAIGESLTSILGADEAGEATKVLSAIEKELQGRVRDKVARYRGVFDDRPEGEREVAREAARKQAEGLSTQRHHRTRCPACDSSGSIQGDPFGPGKVTSDGEDMEVVVKQAMAPRNFSCWACGLKLEGYPELAAAGLGAQYTRTTRYSPEEYYDLISPDNMEEIERIARTSLGLFHPDDREYDNE